ncbi:MAG: hypothetical protein LBM27_03345 [Lactobacillaceae bacterium]|nr:hypothetical protein [Lactobacillaceae bacterium]
MTSKRKQDPEFERGFVKEFKKDNPDKKKNHIPQFFKPIEYVQEYLQTTFGSKEDGFELDVVLAVKINDNWVRSFDGPLNLMANLGFYQDKAYVYLPNVSTEFISKISSGLTTNSESKYDLIVGNVDDAFGILGYIDSSIKDKSKAKFWSLTNVSGPFIQDRTKLSVQQLADARYGSDKNGFLTKAGIRVKPTQAIIASGKMKK